MLSIMRLEITKIASLPIMDKLEGVGIRDAVNIYSIMKVINNDELISCNLFDGITVTIKKKKDLYIIDGITNSPTVIIRESEIIKDEEEMLKFFAAHFNDKTFMNDPRLKAILDSAKNTKSIISDIIESLDEFLEILQDLSIKSGALIVTKQRARYLKDILKCLVNGELKHV